MTPLAQLTRRNRPHYGQLLLVLTLALGAYLSSQAWCCSEGGGRGTVVTLLSPLPRELLERAALFEALRWTFLAAAAAWLCMVAVPYSAWIATLAVTSLVAQHEEQLPYVDHVFHCCNLALAALALWHQVCRVEIRAALARADFYATRVFPRWVYLLIVTSIALSYSRAGFAKLLVSGVAWPNGLSLQLWTSLWGRDSSLTSWVLAHRSGAAALQWLALVAECAALPVVLFRRARLACGLALVGFHMGQSLLFGWAFQANMLLLAATFLPLWRATSWATRRLRRRLRASLPPPSGPLAPLLRFVAARFDGIGLWRREA